MTWSRGWKCWWIVPLLLFGERACAAAPPAFNVPESVDFEADVIYGRGGDVDLRLDIARPRGASKAAPCIVVVHGGGWRGGDKKQHRDLVVKCAEMGYVAATVQYRLCPKYVFPAQVEDVKCAVRYLRNSAEKYQINTKKIGAVGFSAGAHLSMMLGVTSKSDGLEGEGGWPGQDSKVQAVVAFFGPTKLDADDIPFPSRMMLRDFLGGTAQEKSEIYKKASPVTYASKDDAPILIFQGTRDPLVPHTQAYRMVDALTSAGASGRVELLIGASHGWVGDELNHSIQQTTLFFEQHLRK